LASGVPHLPQKFEAGEFSAPHFTQSRASELPQRAQKLLPAGFSQPHFEQRIAPSLPPGFHTIARSRQAMQAAGCMTLCE
jgi:hypothetical protein